MKLNQTCKPQPANAGLLGPLRNAPAGASSIASLPHRAAAGGALIAACLGAVIANSAMADVDARADAEPGVAALQAPAVNYTGMWWAAPAGSQPGWGLSIAHQGDVIFAVWFTYAGNEGHPQWYSMTLDKQADGSYAGSLFRSVQLVPPWYSMDPFSASRLITTSPGAATLTFSSPTTGTFAYEFYGTPGSNAITMQAFGPLPACVWGAQPDLAKATNFTDLWWASPAGQEPGWGVFIAQQGDVIFATWFTYPYWMSVTATKIAPNTYSGTLIRTVGPSCCPGNFSAGSVGLYDAGTATFTFTDGNNGTFFYAVNVFGGGGSGMDTKSITRQVFRPPGTVCQ